MFPTNTSCKNEETDQKFILRTTDRIYAGEYAGDLHNAKEKVEQLVRFGITHFIDLTEKKELKPYSHLLPQNCSHRRFPIKDVSVPSECEAVYELMEYISSVIAVPAYKVYIHCWGGVGRTGTIVACLYEYFGEDYSPAVQHLQRSFSQCPKSQWRKTPETTGQLKFIQSFGSFVKGKKPKPDKRQFPFDRELLEAVINWTLPGLTFFYRDTDVQGDLEEMAKAYRERNIIRAGFFIDCSSRATKPTKRIRFLIASAHAAAVWRVMGDAEAEEWRLNVLDYNSYFKVVDTYQVGDRLQILLLHIPLRGLSLFAQMENIKIGGGVNLVSLARKNFDDKLKMSPLACFESKAWTKRTGMLPGTSAEGWATLDPMSPPNENIANLRSGILILSNDDTNLNKSLKAEDGQ